jgi:hypothetical protein
VNDPTREAITWHLRRPWARPAAFAALRRTLMFRLQAFDSLCGELERHVRVEGLDDPEVGEVFLVSNLGGSWPYG